MAEIFKEPCNMRGNDDQDPVIVMRDGEELILNEDEMRVLSLGPKFCVYNNLCEETFERELEETIIKYRWELMGKEIKDKEIEKFGNEEYGAINSIFTKDELEQHDLEDQLEEAKKRIIFDRTEGKFSYANRRVNEIKGNARVILPKKAKNFDLEVNT